MLNIERPLLRVQHRVVRGERCFGKACQMWFPDRNTPGQLFVCAQKLDCRWIRWQKLMKTLTALFTSIWRIALQTYKICALLFFSASAVITGLLLRERNSKGDPITCQQGQLLWRTYLRGKTLRVYTVSPFIAVTLCQKEEQGMMRMWKVDVKSIKHQWVVSIL